MFICLKVVIIAQIIVIILINKLIIQNAKKISVHSVILIIKNFQIILYCKNFRKITEYLTDQSNYADLTRDLIIRAFLFIFN